MSDIEPPMVLVVEDDRQLADLYARWLESHYAVRTAYDGEAAIGALNETVDVVLLDRRMPGFSGDELLEWMDEQGLPCKVAMVTAVEPDFDILEMSFDDYVVKPVSAETLRIAVQRLVDRRAYDEQLDEYVRLLSKKVALEEQMTRHQLRSNEEFLALEERVGELGERVDRMVEGFDPDDVNAVFRELVPGGEG